MRIKRAHLLEFSIFDDFEIALPKPLNWMAISVENDHVDLYEPGIRAECRRRGGC